MDGKHIVYRAMLDNQLFPVPVSQSGTHAYGALDERIRSAGMAAGTEVDITVALAGKTGVLLKGGIIMDNRCTVYGLTVGYDLPPAAAMSEAGYAPGDCVGVVVTAQAAVRGE